MKKNISYVFRNKTFSGFNLGKAIIIFLAIVGVIVFFPHFFRNTYVVTIERE